MHGGCSSDTGTQRATGGVVEELNEQTLQDAGDGEEANDVTAVSLEE